LKKKIKLNFVGKFLWKTLWFEGFQNLPDFPEFSKTFPMR
jgi:hypothetical protein